MRVYEWCVRVCANVKILSYYGQINISDNMKGWLGMKGERLEILFTNKYFV